MKRAMTLLVCSILSLWAFLANAVTWTTVQGWTGNSTASSTSRKTGKYTVSLEDNLLLQEGTTISIEGNTNTSYINTDALCNGTIATGSGYRNETHTYKLTAGTVATISFDRPMSLYGLQFYTWLFVHDCGWISAA